MACAGCARRRAALLAAGNKVVNAARKAVGIKKMQPRPFLNPRKIRRAR